MQLGLKLLDPALLGGLGLSVVLEGSVAVLEELLLPAIEQTGTDAQFIAEIGDRRLLDEVSLEDGDPLGAGKISARLVHWKPPFR